MTYSSEKQLPEPAPQGDPGSGERDDLVGRLRFYFEYRHSEPLARLRARSLLAQLRLESNRQR